jgi:hypothetical protein
MIMFPTFLMLISNKDLGLTFIMNLCIFINHEQGQIISG